MLLHPVVQVLPGVPLERAEEDARSQVAKAPEAERPGFQLQAARPAGMGPVSQQLPPLRAVRQPVGRPVSRAVSFPQAAVRARRLASHDGIVPLPAPASSASAWVGQHLVRWPNAS